jgi:transcriptional regulator with XRE-family HTH domain
LNPNAIGKKIRELRIQKGMTQASLAAETVTRNMLSLIETGGALPSFATIVALAERLDAPIEYFYSDCEDMNVFRKIGVIEKIREAFDSGDYARCIYRIEHLGVYDEETEYLYAQSSLALGISFYREGKLRCAEGYFEKALAHAQNTHYVSEAFFYVARRYLGAIRFVRDKDPSALGDEVCNDIRNCMEDLGYVTSLSDGPIERKEKSGNPYDKHLDIRARMDSDDPAELIKELKIFLDVLDHKRYAVLRYYVLSDVEYLAQKLGDYRLAYECAAKRLAISETMNA